MSIPPGAAFTAVTATDSPAAFLDAAAEHLRRDALWADPPPLADGCEHDMRLLPVIEFRFTVTCARCGGLDAELSRDMMRNPGGYDLRPDGSIARTVEIRRRDPEEAARLIREKYREHGIPDWLAEEMIRETLQP